MEKLAVYREYLCASPRLSFLFFELTNACNLSCLHCGSGSSPKNRNYLSYESTVKVLDSVSKKYDPRTIMICLSGGEPLLHPDFLRIASSAKKRGFSCGVTTNGTLIDHRIALKLKASGIDSVTFSLDGLKESHDWFRNRKGSFNQTVKGIREMISVSNGSIYIQITTVVHKKNIIELEQMYQLVLDLGVASWRVVNLEPIGRARQHDELLLEREEYRYLLNFIRTKRYSSQVPIDITYGCSHYLTAEYEREVRDSYFICGSGIYVGSVLCNGDIYSCIDIERRPELMQGNITNDDFVDVWENRFQVFRANRSLQCKTCTECEDKHFCNGDSAHTWDYEEQQPMLCLKNYLNHMEEKEA